MNLKGKIYVPISMILVLTMVGCGGSSSSSSNSNEGVTERGEQVAVFIQENNIKETSAVGKRQRISSSLPLKTMLPDIKENASGGGTDKWIIYDKSPRGATISNVFDEEKRSDVIKFEGDGLRNGFVIGFWTSTPWKDTQHKVISWNMKITNNYMLYVRVSTKKGYRYLYYTPTDYNYGVSTYDNPHYIHHGLGINSNNGTWQTFTRDLSADLKDFDSDNSIVSVDGFFVRGSGMFDDIVLLQKKPSSLNEAINRWLLNNKLNLSSDWYNPKIISDDKTRAIVKADDGSPYTNATYILDISDLDNIKQLAKRGWYRYTQPKEVRIKEGDYIALVRNREIVIYDYNSGEEMSHKEISEGIWEVDYLLVTENYAIYKQSYDGNILRKINYTDRRNPIVTTLYSGNVYYSLSPDKTKVLVKDKDENVIEEIQIVGQEVTESDINKAINRWLLSKNLTMERETVVSDDKTRAIVYAYRKGEPYSEITYIFDISNLDDINKLAESPWSHYGYPIEAKIKDSEYIILARNSEFIIYNYNSGKEISNTEIGYISMIGIDNYFVISDDYAIYHYIGKGYSNVLAKIDYRDRKNPVVTTLYSTDQDHSYTLSDDKTKVLVKDKNKNVIDEINL